MSPDKYIKNYINGSLIPAESGDYLENINPATGEVFSYFPNSNTKDVTNAFQAAENAFPNWSKIGVHKRSRILMRIADIIEQDLNSFAIAETKDSGKPLDLTSTVDIVKAHENFRFFSTAILHFSSESNQNEGEAINFTLRQPIGVVGCISPWNLPLFLFTRKIAPALAVGNCVVAKPSEICPMTAYLLSKACMVAGLPNGVLNIVHGLDEKINNAIVRHPKIKAISFTGDTEDGRTIAAIAAPMFKKISLELGGKNPSIIFADCDFEKMMYGTLKSSFSSNGQLSMNNSRLYVERGIYAKFKEELVKRSQFLKIGDPLAKITDLGAIVSKKHLEQLKSYVQLAEVEGGILLCGGKAILLNGGNENGYFFRPTVIEGLTPNCRTNQEEVFGPVVTIAPFDTEAEVIRLANNSNFGLSASIWSQDISKANRIAEELETGMVWVNCWMQGDHRTPFGGVKNSGMGREGGLESLRFFTQAKNVCIKY